MARRYSSLDTKWLIESAGQALLVVLGPREDPRDVALELADLLDELAGGGGYEVDDIVWGYTPDGWSCAVYFEGV